MALPVISPGRHVLSLDSVYMIHTGDSGKTLFVTSINQGLLDSIQWDLSNVVTCGTSCTVEPV